MVVKIHQHNHRGVETTIVDGEIVIFERKIATIDEAALREELVSLMPTFRRDFANVAEANRHPNDAGSVFCLPWRCPISSACHTNWPGSRRSPAARHRP
jgi:hypothetical protein